MRATGVISLFAVATLGACAPAALNPEEIVPAFIAASQADTRTMRMEWQGTVAFDQGDDPVRDPSMLNQTITATFDFNGPDYAGTMDSSNESSSSISYALVGGDSFVNYGDTGWQRNESFGGQVAPELDPMHNLAASDVAYEAIDSFNGREVHRLRVLDPLAALSGSLFDQVTLLGSEMSTNGPAEYLIYVDANGIPVGARMILGLALNMDIGEDPAEPGVPDPPALAVTYQINFDYTFSLWGEPVTISPPQVTGGGFDEPAPPGVK